jgi:hypothetical protein
MTTLIGYIECRLKLSPCSSEFIPKTRKREREDSAVPRPLINDTGIFFIPSSNVAGTEYLLVVPEALLKTVCDAARFRRKVKLIRFTILDLVSTNEGVRGPISMMPKLALLELERIEVLQRSDNFMPQKKPMTLTEFRATEASHDGGTHTIVGTIDSISPIIAVVPTDPFCLVELYQSSAREVDALSCVVVIKGEAALACHAGMLPMDRIVFQSVHRQMWTVRKSLREKGFSNVQVPNRVMVITSSKAVVWKEAKEDSTPTVALSMSMVEGTVDNIRYAKYGIHCIELRNGPARYVIFVTSFPMSTNLQYGLRKGALVKAINVHLIPIRSSKTYFGTCLKSTIVLVRTASEAVMDSSILPRNTIATAVSARPSLVPWRYSRIRRSAFREALAAYLTDNDKLLTGTQDFSRDDLAGSLLRLLVRQDEGFCSKSLASMVVAVESNSKRRDQFAEFFDHGIDHDECDESGKCGCHMRHFNNNKLVSPIILTISVLKEVLLRVMEDRLIEWISQAEDNKIPAGSIASTQLRNDEVARARNRTDAGLVCITGILAALDDCGYVFMIQDGSCCCPITTKEPSPLPRSQSCRNVLCNPQVCIVSAMCLGPLSPTRKGGVGISDGTKSRENLVVALEPWTELVQTAKEGSCSILHCSGYAFMISIHVHCNTIVPIVEHSPAQQNSGEQKLLTVEQILDPHRVIREGDSFAGILCRQRLKFIKIKSGQFCGTMFTLGHCTSPEQRSMDAGSLVTLQSLELNVSMKVSEDRKDKLRKIFESQFAGTNGYFMEEQVCLATAWWKMADGPSSALIACGVDETMKSEHEKKVSTVSRFVPLVIVPTSSQQAGNNGFVRFRCDVIDIDVRLIEIVNIAFPVNHASTSPLSSLGNQKFFRGMIGRLLIGRSSAVPSRALRGIQEVTLGDLCTEICADIRMCSQSALAPSMTRLIRGARLLSVSYCKVQAACAICHKTLVRISERDMSDLSDVTSLQSFWGPQLPLEGKLPTSSEKTVNRIHLKCPNHCPIRSSEIIWECSGILDDGTGQCKLYSERETAIALLGIDSQIARSIEDGAWEIETGVCYQKAMSQSLLKQAIRDARIEISRHVEGRKPKREEIIRMLMPTARASYLLHQYCNTAPSTKQDLDYIVRCKPLSTDAFHLNRAEVETRNDQLMPMDTVVYSLPPLKLNLVSLA